MAVFFVSFAAKGYASHDTSVQDIPFPDLVEQQK